MSLPILFVAITYIVPIKKLGKKMQLMCNIAK